MKLRVSVVLCLIFFVSGILWLISKSGQDTERENSITIHCAAGLRIPVEKIAEEFEKESGIHVQLNFGGSGELYGKLNIVKGDLYIPADSSYLNNTELFTETVSFSRLTAVLMVADENPKGISSIKDLEKESIRVVMAEKSAAVGKLTHEVLEKTGALDKITAGFYSTVPTVNSVATQVALGASDVGIVWDSLKTQYPRHDFISVEEFTSEKREAAIGLIKSSNSLEEARSFIKFLTNSEKGLSIFQNHGFELMENASLSR